MHIVIVIVSVAQLYLIGLLYAISQAGCGCYAVVTSYVIGSMTVLCKIDTFA